MLGLPPRLLMQSPKRPHLLQRYHHQRSELVGICRSVQLLVQDAMVERFSVFDEVLRRLARLAEHRRLLDKEPFEVVAI